MSGGTEALTFHWSDYFVFIVSLVLSGAVGVIQGIIDQRKARKNPKQETKVGERNISVWPASLSVMASTLAAPFVLGVPAELYSNGTEFSILIVGYAIGIPVCTHFFYARFYDMGITSVYESIFAFNQQYLEYRYNKTVRSLCTLIFALSLIIYMGIITYAPAVAFSQVTGLSMQISVLGVGCIGIVYTVVGGLKGVIWVDAIQMLITIAGVLAIIIKGTIDIGGTSVVIERALQGRRIQSPVFSLNPTVRHTFWTQSIGGVFALIVVFTNQSIVQKFVGLPTKKKMYITSYSSMVIISAYLAMSCYAGIVMYAYYVGCSPLLTGKVAKPDQMLPVFVLEIFQGIYGIAGLFTASVFAASLSSLAGGINALAAVTILDVINPVFAKFRPQSKISPRHMIFLFKGLVIIYGLLTIACAYLAPLMGAGLLQLAINLLGVVGAPMFALFLMGIYMPCINAIGAAVGLIISIVLMLWLAMGGIIVTGKYKLLLRMALPLTTQNCTVVSSTASTIDSLSTWVTDSVLDVISAAPPPPLAWPTGVEKYYCVSYMWYHVLAILFAVTAAFIVSLATGFRRGEPVDLTLSYACCYKNVKETLIDDDQFPVYPGKMAANGSHLNPAFSPQAGDLEGGEERPVDVEVPGPAGEQFEEYDDTGTFGYGIFNRNRCSRCRKSRIMHCTKL